MRKRLKNKRRSCGLCKPHKRNMAPRWKPQEEARLREFEKLVKATVRDSQDVLDALESDDG